MKHIRLARPAASGGGEDAATPSKAQQAVAEAAARVAAAGEWPSVAAVADAAGLSKATVSRCASTALAGPRAAWVARHGPHPQWTPDEGPRGAAASNSARASAAEIVRLKAQLAHAVKAVKEERRLRGLDKAELERLRDLETRLLDERRPKRLAAILAAAEAKDASG